MTPLPSKQSVTGFSVLYTTLLLFLLSWLSLSPAEATPSSSTLKTTPAFLVTQSHPEQTTPATSDTWQFNSGFVEWTTPFRLHTFAGSELELREPQLLGSGGGGAVFAFSSTEKERVTVKVSWVSSVASVQKECAILRHLQGVDHVPTCLAQQDYSSGRTWIAMRPVLEGNQLVSQISQLPERLQIQAVRELVTTLVYVLERRVVTTDVQLLLNPETGEWLWIDWTEADILQTPDSSSPSSYTLPALSRVVNVLQEVAALIPPGYESVAQKAAQQALAETQLSSPWDELVADQFGLDES